MPDSMTETLITIKDAAELSGKSIQTIRRAVKGKKLKSVKKKTAQGYNYMVNRESLIEVFKLRIDANNRKQAGIKGARGDLGSEFASIEDIHRLQKDVEGLLDKHEKTKESFSRFMNAFQERFVVMENQLKLLEQPGEKKRWYKFWR